MDAMNTNREYAEKIFNQTRPTQRAIEVFGVESLTPIQRATVDQIEAHLNLVDEVGTEFQCRLDAAKIPFGITRAKLVEIAERKLARRRRSAGARALSRKYGRDAAERIIYRKTGKHVHLQD